MWGVGSSGWRKRKRWDSEEDEDTEGEGRRKERTTCYVGETFKLWAERVGVLIGWHVLQEYFLDLR